MSSSALERLRQSDNFGLIKQQVANAVDQSEGEENVQTVLAKLKTNTSLYAQRLTQAEMSVEIQSLIGRTLPQVALPEQERVHRSIMDHLFGYGIIQELMDDPEVSDIQINGGQYIRYVKGSRQVFTQKFKDDDALFDWVDRKLNGTPFSYNRSDGRVDAFLADGSRLNVKGETTGVQMLEYKGKLIQPPRNEDEAIAWREKAYNGGRIRVMPALIATIRKFLGFFTLEELCEKGMFDERMYHYYDLSSKIRDGFLLSAGTGAGKTTFMNSLVSKTPFDLEIGILEEAPEMNPIHPHVHRYWERAENSQGVGRIGTDTNLKDILRQYLDDLYVGEIRDPIMAYQFLQAANTGSGRCGTTIHANNAIGAVDRLMNLASSSPEKIGQSAVWDNIRNTVKVVNQLERNKTDYKRRIIEVAEIDPSKQNGKVELLHVFTYSRREDHFQFHGLTKRFQEECANYGLTIPKSLLEMQAKDISSCSM